MQIVYDKQLIKVLSQRDVMSVFRLSRKSMAFHFAIEINPLVQ